MDRGEEDRVSTGGGEGREEKDDGGEGGEKKGTGGGKGKGVRMCDMKTPTHHGGCKTQMRVPLHSYSPMRYEHTLTQYPQTYSHCTHLPPT